MEELPDYVDPLIRYRNIINEDVQWPLKKAYTWTIVLQQPPIPRW